MARKPKTLDEGKKHLEDSLTYIPDRYSLGTSRADWVGGATTDQSETNWWNQLTQAHSADKRRNNVKAAGNPKYKTGCESKGAPVISERIRAQLDTWATNFKKPYDAVVSLLPTLPPKTTDPTRNIDTRLKPVVNTFVKNKTK